MGHYKQVQIDGQRVTYHRHLMEQHIGRKLSPSEIVHHIDGNKHNNVIDNLEVRNTREHNIASGRLNRPSAKLRIGDIAVIRKMLNDGIKRYVIAFAYGVGREAIDSINRKRTWGWV